MIGWILAAARLRRAGRRYEQGRYVEAARDLEDARAARPGLPLYQQYRGVLALKAGRLEEAEEALRLAEAEGGDAFTLRLAQGAAAIVRRRPGEARKRFEEALAAFPVAYETLYHVGLSRFLEGDEAGARADFVRLLGRDDEALFKRLEQIGALRATKR
jgi:predicted Zn-dependent protease